MAIMSLMALRVLSIVYAVRSSAISASKMMVKEDELLPDSRLAMIAAALRVSALGRR